MDRSGNTQSNHSRNVVKHLDKCWIKKHGSPKSILSDQGRQFVSLRYKEYLKLNNIKPILTSPYNPTGNSVVERINLNIGNITRILKNESLSSLKNKLILHLNYTTNRMISFSPFELVYKRAPFNWTNKIISENLIREALNNTKLKEKELVKRNKKRRFVLLNVGEKVLLKKHSPDKLDDKWEGP
jgi:transposase InsO family protein